MLSKIRSVNATIGQNKNTATDLPSDFAYKYIIYPEITSKEKVRECALLSLDPCVVNSIGSILDGSKFELHKEYNTDTYFGDEDTPEGIPVTIGEGSSKKHIIDKNGNSGQSILTDTRCVFVPSNTKIKEMSGIGFSNVAGSAEDPKRFSYAAYSFGVRNSLLI